MDNMEQENLELFPQKVKLRIEIFFREKKKRFGKSKLFTSPIQGYPFDVILRVTNISDVIFKGAVVSSAIFKFHSASTSITLDGEKHIHALNPKEIIELVIDQVILKVDGASWFEMDITPEEGQELHTYQYDSHHKSDSKYKVVNKWGNTIFNEGKLASLQTTTNNYILILTAITVLEAVFGIKNILKWLAMLIANLFSFLSYVFSYLSAFT